MEGARMDHRYSARHISRGRHAVDAANGEQKRMRFRPKRKRQLLPAAAALTIAGALIGGVGAAVHFSSPNVTNNAVEQYNPADFAPPADRDVALERGSRDEERAAPDASAAIQSESKNAVGPCEASFYDEPQKTASGEVFDPEALTAAHRDLPFGTKVRVTNVTTGNQVVVRVNDRGPYAEGRCLDLSEAAFRTIASVGAGVADVRYEVLG
jgi:rare lipoprotein A (peptidoglycan hydrolase)